MFPTSGSLLHDCQKFGTIRSSQHPLPSAAFPETQTPSQRCFAGFLIHGCCLWQRLKLVPCLALCSQSLWSSCSSLASSARATSTLGAALWRRCRNAWEQVQEDTSLHVPGSSVCILRTQPCEVQCLKLSIYLGLFCRLHSLCRLLCLLLSKGLKGSTQMTRHHCLVHQLHVRIIVIPSMSSCPTELHLLANHLQWLESVKAASTNPASLPPEQCGTTVAI